MYHFMVLCVNLVGSREESVFLVIQVISRTQFHSIVESTKGPIPLLVVSQEPVPGFWRLPALFGSWHLTSIFKANNSR